MSATQPGVGTIESKTWNFEQVEELGSGAKVVRMSASDLFHGDIEGAAAAEFVAVLRTDNSSEFAGLYRVMGELGGRSGSFVLRTVGRSNSEGTTEGTWEIVRGASDGDLVGLAGAGSFSYEPGGSSRYSLEYRFDS